MAQLEEKIPLWLDIKKEYVDDNLDRLISYLANNRARSEEDTFYKITLDLVEQRVGDLLTAIKSKPLYHKDTEPEQLTFNIRLLATHMLALPTSTRHKEIYLALIFQMHQLVGKFGENLTSTALESLKYEKVESPGFAFHDIVDFKPEVFAHHIFTHSRFADPIQGWYLYENQGRAWINNQGLTITATGKTRDEEINHKLSHSLVIDNACRIGTASSDKIKTSEADDLGVMDAFTSQFIDAMHEPLRQPKEKTRISYSQGDDVVVEITDIQVFNISHAEIRVRTVDANYNPLEGKIVFSQISVCMYFTALIHKYFRVGNRIRCTLVNAARNEFSFEEQLKEFFVEDTRNNVGTDTPFYARLLTYNKVYYNWLSAFGVVICTYNTGDYQPKDIAELQIQNFDYGDNYGKINAKILRPVSEEELNPDDFDNEQIRQEAIQAFVDSTPEVAEVETEGHESLIRRLEPGTLEILMRLFHHHQRSLLRPSQRFLYLLNSEIIATLLNDRANASYLRFTTTYLHAIVNFATDEKIDDIELQPDEEYADSTPVRLRQSVLTLLKEYGKTESSEVLARAIHTPDAEMPLLPKLARLIEASNTIRDTLSTSSINIIKREITRTLSIETEEDVDLEADSRAYLGTESQTVEFKTSMVFPPDNNMQPNQTQQTFNVFRAVCGFLNSTLGGTVYIGVNDLGYVTGLEEDFRFLHCNSFDSYARLHIQDQLIRRFGLDVMTYIHIDPAFDEQVAVIRVEPHPFRVVELDGVAYLRVERESREMSDNVKKELLAKKLFTDKNKMDAILQLQHAAYARRQVVLHSYASSSSGRIADRLVEPYSVMHEDGLVACYDYESHSCKVFHIARIGYVEVTDNKWMNPHKHRQFDVDAFHCTGESNIHVSLELDLLAKNLLVEEYPRTRHDISPCKGDDNLWYYNGTVRSTDGIGRFVRGLADHIKVIEGL